MHSMCVRLNNARSCTSPTISTRDPLPGAWTNRKMVHQRPQPHFCQKGAEGQGEEIHHCGKVCLCPVYRPTTCVYRLSAAAPLPSALHDGVASVVPAMTASAVRHRLWGTAAGRHLFGKQAMTPAMKKCIRACVIFHGGVGSPMNLGCIKHIAGGASQVYSSLSQWPTFKLLGMTNK